MLSHTKSFDSNVNGGYTFWCSTSGTFSGNLLLDSNVVRILTEEVGHGTWVFLFESGNVGNVFFIRHGMTKDFLAVLFDRGPRHISTATVADDGNFLTGLGLDGEFDLIKISKVGSTGSLEGLATGEFLVGGAGFDIVDGNVEKGNQESQFVNDHVLAHSFAIALKAFSKTFRCVFVSVVTDKGDGSSIFGRIFTSLSDVFANILIVSHQHGDTSRLGLVAHGF
mmetsp:Transcript_10653/g.21882  ORF Transcript_10653/g.21882 Transcript_10653/m.21882 type:complete len:224 (-) Transcript_10653:464-1135(-)